MKPSKIIALVLICMVAFVANNAAAFQGLYFSEADYLNDLAIYASNTYTEGFEGADWSGARYPSTVPSVSAQGFDWSTDLDGISTIDGWARTGGYGIFNSVGDPDRLFVQHSSATFVGFGGWFLASDATANFEFDAANLSGSLAVNSNQHVFFGMIDTDGLGAVRTGVDVAGHWGADDFTFGTTNDQVIPEPTTLLLFGTGLAGLGYVRRKRLSKKQ